jgi:hypothetical protein
MKTRSDTAEAQKELFQGMSPEEYRDAVIVGCLSSLNQITVGELTAHARNTSFTISHHQTWQDAL